MPAISDVIEFIDSKSHTENLETTRYNELRAILISKLQNLEEKNYETIGKLNYYLLLLGLKFNHINLEEADRLYLLIINSFEKQEEISRKEATKFHNKNKHVNQIQLKYFYRLIEHYLNNLENLFREKYFYDHAKKAYADKLHFKASQKLFEKEFLDFFEYKREELINKFRTHYVIYTIFGGIGMILFWKGVWDLAYEIPIISGHWGSIIVGLILMVLTGFIASIGDRSIVSTTDKFEE